MINFENYYFLCLNEKSVYLLCGLVFLMLLKFFSTLLSCDLSSRRV